MRIRHWNNLCGYGVWDVVVIAPVFSNGLLVTVIKKLSVIAKQRGSHFGLCLNLRSSVQIKQNGIQLLMYSSYKIRLII